MWCSPRREELENRNFPGEEKEVVAKIRGIIMLCLRLLCHSVLRRRRRRGKEVPVSGV